MGVVWEVPADCVCLPNGLAKAIHRLCADYVLPEPAIMARRYCSIKTPKAQPVVSHPVNRGPSRVR